MRGVARVAVLLAFASSACTQPRLALVFFGDPDTQLPIADACILRRDAVLSTVRGVVVLAVGTTSRACHWSYHDLGGPLPANRWSALSDALSGVDLIGSLPLDESVDLYMMGRDASGAPDVTADFSTLFCAHSIAPLVFGSDGRVQLALNCIAPQTRSNCVDAVTVCR